MSPGLQLAQLFLLAWAGFLGVGSLVAAVVVRFFGTQISTWAPRARHKAVATLAGLPVFLSFSLLFAASLPSLLALVVPSLDHCSIHDDGHAHLCFSHLPTLGLPLGLDLTLGLIASHTLLRVLFAAVRLLRANDTAVLLARTGERDPDSGVTIIETPRPICVAAGILRPEVLVSRRLWNELNETERAVVLAHERTHVRRKDTLFGSIVRTLAFVHLPSIRGWLVSEVEVAAEQACDEEAARVVGDRLSVASTILKVERAARQDAERTALDLVAAACAARAVERRVQALLIEPKQERSFRPLVIPIGVVLALVLLLADQLHHFTESVLSLVIY
jgi:Zn-dependent protease with chaperone function